MAFSKQVLSLKSTNPIPRYWQFSEKALVESKFSPLLNFRSFFEKKFFTKPKFCVSRVLMKSNGHFRTVTWSKIRQPHPEISIVFRDNSCLKKKIKKNQKSKFPSTLYLQNYSLPNSPSTQKSNPFSLHKILC